MLHKNYTAYSKCCSYAIDDFYVVLYPKIRAEKKKNVCMPASKDGISFVVRNMTGPLNYVYCCYKYFPLLPVGWK